MQELQNTIINTATGLDYRSLILSVLPLATILGFIFIGYQKGLVKQLATILSVVLTMYLVYILTPYITDYLEKNTTIKDAIVKEMNDAFREANSVRDNSIYDNQVETIESYQLPQVIKSMLVENDTESVYSILAVSIFEEYVSVFLARKILQIMSFLITFIMVMLFLKITVLSMEFIAKLPVISGFNKVAGGLVGLSEGLLVVWVVMTVGTIFFSSKMHK